MQITDMLSQYNRNIANGVEISGGTQGIKEVVSSLQEMAVGNVFEGSVNSLEDGVVTLGLSDGKIVQAKLDSGVSVRVGESMFFQVKSNNGVQIAIRPFSNGISTNPTLLNALEAANLQVNSKTLTMVNTMMEQAMSIDKQSLLNMARLVMGNEGIDIISIVQMEKLGIPVTEEMAAQFENYKSDQYAILNQLESVMEELPERLAGGSLSQKELLDFNQQMVKVFLGEGQVAKELQPGKVVKVVENVQMEEMPQNTENTQAVKVLQTVEGTQNGEVLQRVEGTQPEEVQQMIEDIKPGEVQQNVESTQPEEVQQNVESIQPGKVQQVMEDTQSGRIQQMVENEPVEIKNLFTGRELHQLFERLGKVPELSQNPVLFQEGVWNRNITSKELLQILGQAFSSKDPISRQALSELVSSKEYRALVRNVMEQQWLLKPEELKTEHKVKELYQRLDEQLNQMEKVLKNFGQNTSQLTDTVANVRSNIQFMSQLNQTYAYVQLPLKMAGQNAHSDLYIYTDKRKTREKDGELTAFLHLDLEHLGSTDVSVKLHQKQVTTNFYLADDLSYELIFKHLDILQKRLEEKGYNAKIQVINQEEKVNFVEAILKQGTPSVGGMVHRYSFDVRA